MSSIDEVIHEIDIFLEESKLYSPSEQKEIKDKFRIKLENVQERVAEIDNDSEIFTLVKNANIFRIIQELEKDNVDEISDKLINSNNKVKSIYSSDHFKGSNKEYSKFIVLASKRTGSSFLCSLLRSHPDLLCFGELFINNQIQFSYKGYPEPDCDLTLKQRNDNPIGFLENSIYCNYNKKIKQVGFKLLYNQANLGELPLVWDYLKNDKSIQIIHLKRRNYLRTILSYKKALETKVWTKRKYVNNIFNTKSSDNHPINLDYNECLYYFIHLENREKEYDKLFGQHKILNLFYEDLADNTDEKIKEVLEFLGIENRSLKSDMLKQAKKPLNKAITNYYELKEQFKESKWAVFFED